MAEKSEKRIKKIVEQITDDKAAEILGDHEFMRSKKLDRLFHVVRDPRDPSIIVSMTVMENAPLSL